MDKFLCFCTLKGCGNPSNNTEAVLRQSEEGTELPGAARQEGFLLLLSPTSAGTSRGGQGQDRGFSWSQSLSRGSRHGHSSDDVPSWEDVREADNAFRQLWALSPSLTVAENRPEEKAYPV